MAVWALSAAVLVLLVLALALGAQNAAAGRMERESAAAALQARQISIAATDLLQAITDAETAERGYLLTGRAEHLGPYQAAHPRAQKALSVLLSLSRSEPAYADGIEAIRRLANQRLAGLDAIVRRARSGGREEAVALVNASQGLAMMSELRRSLQVLAERTRAEEAAVREERLRLQQQGRMLQFGLAAAIVLALVIAIASLASERTTARQAAAMQARLRDELQTAKERAEEAYEAKSRFLAAASHDMRQPLHALALYISTLERRVESQQAREILANMDSAVRSMTRLFTALLDLARLEAGVLKADPIDFPVGDLLSEVATQSVDPQTEDAARIRTACTGLHVRSDPDLLEIALRNLTSNALKHSRGGRVLLGCRRVGGQVRIEVHDDGAGIPDDQVERLFAEFVRGEAARATEGVGLGLAIVERLAKLLGHKLSVRSAVGRGTVFAITVPRARPTAAAARPAQTPPSLALKRVLLADDEPLALDAMKRVLEDAGAQVVTAESADRVREVAGEGFDLYVFDLNLGRGNGLDLLDELAVAKGRPVPGLIVTGATTADMLAQLRRSGRPWITKPISAAVLASAAADLLSGPVTRPPT